MSRWTFAFAILGGFNTFAATHNFNAGCAVTLVTLAICYAISERAA